MYIGITGEALLRKKKFASLLQPYDERCGSAAAYVKEVHPVVGVQTGELQDPMVRCEPLHWCGPLQQLHCHPSPRLGTLQGAELSR